MAINSFGIRRYYIFKYVVDHNGEPTEYQGEVQAFVDAEDSFDAMDKAGFDDFNAYGANLVDNVEDFEKAIADERKLLKKLSKELKEWKDADEAEQRKILEERKCPNCDIQMDKAFRCPQCGYGHEAGNVIKEIEKTIKTEKKKGNDVSELESIRDALQAEVDRQDEVANQ